LFFPSLAGTCIDGVPVSFFYSGMARDLLPELIADVKVAIDAALAVCGLGGPLRREDGEQAAEHLLRVLGKRGWKITREQYRIPFGRLFAVLFNL
jgi:hypothetical protein